MVRLVTKQQIVSVEEVIGGTTPGSGLTDPLNADVVALRATLDPDPTFIERQIARPTLTRVLGTIGQTTAQITIPVEMAGTVGGTFGDGPPAWSKFMKAAGFKQVSGYSITIGAIAGGPFRHGEILNGPTTSRYRVLGDTFDGSTTLYAELLEGTAAAELLTGQSTGATATSTAVSLNVFAWYPTSIVEKVMTTSIAMAPGVFVLGDVIRGQTSRAVAVVTRTAIADTNLYFSPEEGTFLTSENIDIIAPVGRIATGAAILAADPAEQFVTGGSLSIRLNEDGIAKTATGARFNFAFAADANGQGIITFTGQGTFSNAIDSPFLEASASSAQPPIFRSAAVAIGDETTQYDVVSEQITSCISSFGFDLGNVLSPRICANSATGIREILISARAATGSIDPEAQAEAYYPWLTRARTGVPFRMKLNLGTGNGRFTFFIPGAQTTGIPSGDRNGILTRQLAFNATGGDLINLNGADVKLNSFGGDSELVLVHIVAA